jgi:hypothetical protein
MTPYPIFLKLLLEHKLLMAVLSSCSLAPIFDSHIPCLFVSDKSVVLEEISIDKYLFKHCVVALDDDGYVSIRLSGGERTLFDERTQYFGLTIYDPITELMKEQNVQPPRPYKYLFRDFDIPISIMLKPPCSSGRVGISINSNPNQIFAETLAERYLRLIKEKE